MTSNRSSEAMLHVHDLGVTYPGDVVALRATQLSMHRGEFTVLLGLSGAGKSTLLRCINHLVVPTTGRIESARHGNLDKASILRAHRRSTAMVFQHHQLIERHSAMQNVLMGRMAYHGFWRSLLPLPQEDIGIAVQSLERVGLGDKLFTRVDQLSGGQRQRVGIARALAQQPEMILADEPVASLDPETSEKVLTLLQTVCREDGITAVVSLHQLEYARRFADRIIGLANASVVFDGAPNEMTEQALERIYRNVKHCPKPKPRNPEPEKSLNTPTEMVV
ncbi:phosphonate ABC transporter ATP-binding protein [Allohahella sp. A8]|uniref:phosphonate ABC transporter ATP-binding protein n=1 Tax=Allohahella sp. A8 TaxID=3141461 RepID=UPI003A7F8BFF